MQVARAAFPHGKAYLTLRDALGTIVADEDFAPLFPSCGQPGLSPWRLALVTVMQFRENLADRQAAEAVRARIDWKDLLGLELTRPAIAWS
jgi:transposase